MGERRVGKEKNQSNGDDSGEKKSRFQPLSNTIQEASNT
jgi:hypothetical protein